MRGRELREPAVPAMPLQRTDTGGSEEIAPGIFRLTFPRDFDFVPGQTVAITVDPALAPRYYSIASGCRDPIVEILYDLVPGGLLTPRLACLRRGDALFVSRPFGAFSDEEGASVWIAAGTGVAPFASMARSGMLSEKTLVQGSRTLAGLYARSYFSSVLKDRYVPCCSGESAPGVFAGRSTAWLAGRELPAARRWLLCGSSRMVVDARDILISRGVPFTSVVAEIYF